MLMAAVVEPDAFSLGCFTQPGYQDQAALFFRGIDSNGTILVDADGWLWDELGVAIDRLPIKYRQEASIWYAEFRKKQKRGKVVRCRADACRTSSSQPALERARRVASGALADAIFVSSANFDGLTSSGDSSVTVHRLSEYTRSAFERKRHWYMDDLPPVDLLVPSDFDELLIRSIRFSVWLRFFDKQIGKGVNLSNFRRGISRVLELWRTNAHFRPQYIEIVTTQSDIIRNEESEHVRRGKHERSVEAYSRVQRDLIQPLRTTFPFDIRLLVKNDQRNIFHARHLQTQSVAILFERGFDFFNDDDTLRRNIVKVDKGSGGHLNECRRLPDFHRATTSGDSD